MTIDTQKLRDGPYLRDGKETTRIMNEAADALDALAAEVAELTTLCQRQSDLLSQTAVAVRGPEPELTLYSHADIPSRVKAVVDDCGAQAAEIARLREAAKMLADWAEHEVGAEPDLTPGLAEVRAALSGESKC